MVTGSIRSAGIVNRNHNIYSNGNDLLHSFQFKTVRSNELLLQLKGKEISADFEKQLFSLYLLTVGKSAISMCKLYETDIRSDDANSFICLLEYEVKDFKSWLDLHRITLVEYRTSITNPSRCVVLKTLLKLPRN
ncbi:MAG: hypothetical protein ACK4M7_00810 [Burkholderiales bacterium]